MEATALGGSASAADVWFRLAHALHHATDTLGVRSC